MVLANQNAKLTSPDQGFIVSPLVLIRKPWERGCPASFTSGNQCRERIVFQPWD
jgi:hypothetical protein